MRSIHGLIGAAALAAAAGSVFAHVGDVGVAIDSGALVTGVVEDTGFGEVVLPGQRVFGGDLTFGPGEGDEPGFFTEAGLISGGASLGFNIRGQMRGWDVGFANANSFSAETMKLEHPDGVQFVETPTTAGIVNGWSFIFPNVGDFDDHPIYYVQGRTGPGIYVIEMELKTSQAGVANSLPFFLVINDGLDEETHEAAIEWVEDNLVPAPGSLALVGIGVLAATRRRRG
jgi:hypothetical protein